MPGRSPQDEGRFADAVARATRARATLEAIERHSLGGLALDALAIAAHAGRPTLLPLPARHPVTRRLAPAVRAAARPDP